MSRENLEILIERLSEDLGLGDLRLDPELDACGFVADGRLDVLIEFDDASASVILTATIGDLPVENRGAVLQDLLDANYYAIGSGGGTFATNSDLGKVYLQIRESTAQLDKTRLVQLVQSLLNTGDAWQERLTGGAAAAGSAPAPSGTGSGESGTPEGTFGRMFPGGLV
ncbi:hypothetical protein DB346_03475 [Verrucomicrobia bacterium LW23]|nr:hypothetical protein DB346_03475 [Verrucomicrobia bacterium LW23]